MASARTPSGEHTPLHPARMALLLRRAGVAARALAVVLLALALAGAGLLLAPFTAEAPAIDPPPPLVEAGCPPAAVAAVAGAAGISAPEEAVPDGHPEACRAAGRARAVTGLLMLLAGVLNAAAVLEWARVRQRRRRR